MTHKLIIAYATVDGTKRSFTYNYASPYVSASTVSSLCEALLTNASIFAYPPAEIISAKLVTTVEEDIDISD